MQDADGWREAQKLPNTLQTRLETTSRGLSKIYYYCGLSKIEAFCGSSWVSRNQHGKVVMHSRR